MTEKTFNTAAHPCRKTVRRGAVVHEAIIATLLATMVIVGAAEVMVAVSKQNREVKRRSFARREAANLMEEAMLVPWQELAADAGRSFELSAAANNHLPNAKLAVGVVEGDADAMRVTIEVTWGDGGEALARPMRLVAWRHPPKESES